MHCGFKWAIGLASNIKRRRPAARLALCVALAADLPSFDSLRQVPPGFVEFCRRVGVRISVILPRSVPPIRTGRLGVPVIPPGFDSAVHHASRRRGQAAESYCRQPQFVDACGGKCEFAMFLHFFPQCQDDRHLHRSLRLLQGRSGRKWVSLRPHADNRNVETRVPSAPSRSETQPEDTRTHGYSKSSDSRSARKRPRHH